jgi:hypothetical protein
VVFAGGALATLGAVWAAGQYPLSPVSLFTFGQPRVGDKDFVQHLNTVTGYTARLIHRLDVVPLVPLNRQGFEHYYPAGYLGCSAAERLTALLKFVKHRSQFYLRYVADSRWGMIMPSLLVGVGDHFMDRSAYRAQHGTEWHSMLQLAKPPWRFASPWLACLHAWLLSLMTMACYRKLPCLSFRNVPHHERSLPQPMLCCGA